MPATLAVAVATAALASAIAYPTLVRPMLVRFQVVDHAVARSSHQGTVLRGGGWAIAVGALAGWLVLNVRDGTAAGVAVLACALVLGVVGATDDVRPLPALTRLGAQVLTGAAVAAATSDRPLLVALLVGAATVPLLVNAVNFMDGVDSITSLTVAAVAVVWTAAGVMLDLPVFAGLAAVAGGAALGFLPWNVRTRVFMGDIGSYLLGGWLAATALVGDAVGVPLTVLVAPTLPYLVDVGATLVLRRSRGEPLMEAHRDHAYQELAAGRLRHTAVGTVWGALALASGTAVLLAPDPWRPDTATLAGLVLVGLWATVQRTSGQP